MAKYSGVPVWNALSNDHHPTQVLADLMTLKEEFGFIAGLKLAYVGDGRNNMGNSLMIAACKMGLDLRIVAPKPLQPSQAAVRRHLDRERHSLATITVSENIRECVHSSHAVYGDIWLSMGEEALVAERIPMLQAFKIDDGVLDATGRPDSIFLHCLPSLHDNETQFAKQHPDVLDTSTELF